MDLHSACERGHIDEVRRIIRQCRTKDLDECKYYKIPGCVEEKHSVTPLYVASFFGRYRCVRALILAGADPNKREESYGQTPCHVAAQIPENDACLRVLLAGNADPTIPTREGWTPLSLAALAGCCENIRLLLATERVQIDRKSHDGTTPCIAATMGNRPEALRLLLAAGADADLTNDRGRTPLTTAAMEGYSSCVDALRARDSPRERESRVGISLRQGLFSDVERRAIYIILMLSDRHERSSGFPFCVWMSLLQCTIPGGVFYTDCDDEGPVKRARFRGFYGLGWFETGAKAWQ